MKKEMCNELAQSIHEADKITKGLKKPSRVFKYKPVDIKKIRSKNGGDRLR